MGKALTRSMLGLDKMKAAKRSSSGSVTHTVLVNAWRRKQSESQKKAARRHSRAGLLKQCELMVYECSNRLLPRIRARGCRGWCRFAGMEIIPVHDGVKTEHERPLRLPPPEGPDREHDDVAVAQRGVHDLGTVRKHLSAG